MTPRGPAPSNHDQPRFYRKTFAITLSLVGMLIWAAMATVTHALPFAPGAALWSSLTSATPLAGTMVNGTPDSSAFSLKSLPASMPPYCTSSGATSLGKHLTVAPDSVVCGNVLVLGGDELTLGYVRGSIQVVGGSATIVGHVAGDVTAVGGDVTVLTGGQVTGAVRSIGGTITVEPGALAPQTHEMSSPQPMIPELSSGDDRVSFWLGLLFWLSASVGLAAIVPEAVGHVRYMVTHHLALSAGVGLALALLGIMAALVLALTCLGIPLALGIAVAGWVAWVVGSVGVGTWIGGALLDGLRITREPSLIAAAALGAVVLALLKVIPLIGPIVELFVGFIALGAAILALLSARRGTHTRLR